MDNITVLRNAEYTPIAVKVDGECNHNGETEIESIDNGFPDEQRGDFQSNIQLMICCVTCGEPLEFLTDEEKYTE